MSEYPIDALILSHMQPGVGYRRRRIRFLIGSAYTTKNVERATRRMCKAGLLVEDDGTYAIKPEDAKCTV